MSANLSIPESHWLGGRKWKVYDGICRVRIIRTCTSTRKELRESSAKLHHALTLPNRHFSSPPRSTITCPTVSDTHSVKVKVKGDDSIRSGPHGRVSVHRHAGAEAPSVFQSGLPATSTSNRCPKKRFQRYRQWRRRGKSEDPVGVCSKSGRDRTRHHRDDGEVATIDAA